MRERHRLWRGITSGLYAVIATICGVSLAGIVLLSGGSDGASALAQIAGEATPSAAPPALATPEIGLASGGDPTRSGILTGPGPEGQIGIRWTIEGSGDPGKPVVAGNLLLLGSDTTLTAYDQSDGTPVWDVTRETALSDPFISGGIAYLTDQTHLVALDATTGEVQWETNLAFGREEPSTDTDRPTRSLEPAVADGVAYVLSGSLAYAIDAGNGDYLWRYDIGAYIAQGPPTITPRAIVFPARDTDGRIIAFSLDRGDGQQLWAKSGLSDDADAGVPTFTSLDDLVLARGWSGSRPRDIIAIDAVTGSPLWTGDCASEADVTLIMDGTAILVCSDMLTSFNLATGIQQAFSPVQSGTPIGILDRTLLLAGEGESGPVITTLDLETTQPGWAYTLPLTVDGAIRPTGTAANGTIFVLTVTDPALEGGSAAYALTAIGGTEGPFGAPLPFAANPPKPGTFLRIATATELRAAPSVEGASLAPLAEGDQVLITGAIEVVDGNTWWEIDDPASGDSGWVEPGAFEPLPGN
jgi:outer membrane protein assembly factor BamB